MFKIGILITIICKLKKKVGKSNVQELVHPNQNTRRESEELYTYILTNVCNFLWFLYSLVSLLGKMVSILSEISTEQYAVLANNCFKTLKLLKAEFLYTEYPEESIYCLYIII